MRIAITGGIAEGKTTVLNWIREAGWPTCSSDDAAREVVNDPAVQRELARIAGLQVPIQPAALREAILSSSEVRRAINRLLHPLIGRVTAKSEAVFHEVPLLFEACLQNRYDQVWVVHCGEEEQKRRLVARYGDEATVERLLSLQLPAKSRLIFADREIRTNSNLDTVRTVLAHALSETFFSAHGDP